MDFNQPHFSFGKEKKFPKSYNLYNSVSLFPEQEEFERALHLVKHCSVQQGILVAGELATLCSSGAVLKRDLENLHAQYTQNIKGITGNSYLLKKAKKLSSVHSVHGKS